MIDNIDEEPKLSQRGALLTQIITAVLVLILTIAGRSLLGAGS